MKRAFILIILLSIFFSSSAQDYWMQINIPDSVHPNRMAQSSSGELYLATNYGVFKSIDNGLLWNHTGALYNGFRDIAITNDNTIFVGGWDLYKSNDSGQSFELVSPAIDLLSLMISSSNTFYAGKSGGIYKSSDEGYTWEWVHQTGNSQLFLDFVEKDTSIYAASVDLAGKVGGIFISDYSGTTWNQHALEKTSLRNIVLDNVNKILAASTGSLLYGPGVFRSDIMGNNFEAIYSDNEVNAVAVDQYGGIYIGLESDLSIDWGVMYSSDDGVTWEDDSSGIEECSYFNQIFISSNNYVFAITEIPFKLYRSLNPIVSMEESTALDIFDVFRFKQTWTLFS